jgi:hypothetical protein
MVTIDLDGFEHLRGHCLEYTGLEQHPQRNMLFHEAWTQGIEKGILGVYGAMEKIAAQLEMRKAG